MQDNHDPYEPIIATRPSRQPVREDTQSPLGMALAVTAAAVAAILLVWWLMGRAPKENASTSPEADAALPETRVDEATLAPTTNLGSSQESPQESVAPSAEPAADSEPTDDVPEVVPDSGEQASLPPTPVPVRFTSPDTQVQFELHALSNPPDSSPPLTIKAGEVVDVSPGTYRVAVTGARLQKLEAEITFTGDRPLEYSVELCADAQREEETLTGQVVEERSCASTAECESMFAVLSEQAEQFVRDPAFRRQQCAKWRPAAMPDGQWTLDVKCGGESLATTCRIEIAQGACSFTEPRRTVRGEACPRTELK